jgi:phage terminase small subunit
MGRQRKLVKGLSKIERDNLTVKQEVFVTELFNNGFNGQAALKKAYVTKNPDVMLNNVLKSKKIQEVIQRRKEELRNRFVVEAEIAFNYLVGLIQDEEATKEVRLKAAKDLLDRAGLAASDKLEISGNITIDNNQTRELIKRARFTGNTIDISDSTHIEQQ